MIIGILAEIYQFMFIMSIIYIIHIIIDILIKAYSKIYFGNDTKFVMTGVEKMILWISIGVFISFIL